MKLDRCDQIVFSTRRFTSAWPELKLPAGVFTELIGTEAIEVSLGLALDRHARVAEALEGEEGPIALLAAALENIFDARLGRAIVAVVEAIVPVDDLGVLDGHPGARLSLHGEGDIACKVLAEIVDRPLLGILPGEDGSEGLELAHRRDLVRAPAGRCRR